jgi:hypothetical protein
MIINYSVLDSKASVKAVLNNWESLYVQFKDLQTGEQRPFYSRFHNRTIRHVRISWLGNTNSPPLSSGELLPIQVSLPSLQDDEDEQPVAPRGRMEDTSPVSGKGKRRASSAD